MSGLSLMQTRDYIDKLGDLDEEIIRVCRTGEAVAKRAPKNHADEVSRLQAAMESAQSCQEHVRCAKEALLRFDGFLHAVRPSVRQALMHPDSGGPAARFFDGVGRKAGPALEHHVGGLAEEGVEAIGRVKASLKALRIAEESDERRDDAKLSCKALEKVLSAAERTIEKAIKAADKGTFPPRHEDRVEETPEAPVEEVEEVEVIEGKTAGYDLSAGGLPDFIKEKQEEREGKKDEDEDDKSDKKAGKMPPQFAENAQKKKDEAAGKKDDDKEDEDDKSDKKAGKMPPQFAENAQKKKDEAAGKKDDDEDDDKKSDKKAHGYTLTAGLPPEFLENAQKKKDEAKGKKDDDKDDDKSDKKAHGYRLTADSEDPDPSMKKTLPGEDDDGEPVVDKSAKAKKSESQDPGDPSMDSEEEGEGEGYDPGHVIEAAGHGYQLTDPPEHGYELTA